MFYVYLLELMVLEGSLHHGGGAQPKENGSLMGQEAGKGRG